jgi:hypothetical protein
MYQLRAEGIKQQDKTAHQSDIHGRHQPTAEEESAFDCYFEGVIIHGNRFRETGLTS